jgi:hypothetical protein
VRRDVRVAEGQREQIRREAGPCQCGVCCFQRGDELDEHQQRELLRYLLDSYYRYFVYAAREEGGRVGRGGRGAAWGAWTAASALGCQGWTTFQGLPRPAAKACQGSPPRPPALSATRPGGSGADGTTGSSMMLKAA